MEDEVARGSKRVTETLLDDDEERRKYMTIDDGLDEPTDAPMDEASRDAVMGETDRKILGYAIMGVDVSEIYSPARITKVCARFGLTPGSAMNLQNGYDFDTLEDRNRAVKRLLEGKPKLLIGSPPCTYFSVLQELNK